MQTRMPFGINQKIKLVIWDLDDTLWKGILAEGDDIVSYTSRFEIVRELNRRGIVSAIVSKNEFEKTKARLEEFGYWDDFVFPRISFDPKGPVIAQLIKDMALRPVNVLFIDDNDSNLNEALHYVPDLNCLNANQCDSILDSQYLKGKDDSSLSRHKQYKQMEKRVEASHGFSSNEDFLKSIHIRAEIKPYSDEVADRAYELVDRTNQLNYTKKRPSKEEFRKFMSDPNVEGNLVRIIDDFGDNGYVGFYAVDRSIPEGKGLVHFCFSCRVLGYYVEQWVYARLGFPNIEIVGEVAVQLNKTNNPSWITLETAIAETDLGELVIDRPIRVFAVGACYLQNVIGRLTDALMDVDFIFRFENEFDYRFDSTPYLRSCLFMRPEDRKEILKYPRLEKYKDYFPPDALFKDFDYLFIGPTGDYEKRFSTLKNAPTIILNSDLLKEDGENPHDITKEEIISNLEDILSKLKPHQKIILMKEPQSEELRKLSEGTSGLYSSRFADFNKLLELNSGIENFRLLHKDRVLIWDIGKVVRHREDCHDMLNHWTPKASSDLTFELIQLILNDNQKQESRGSYSLIADNETSLRIKELALKNNGYSLHDVYLNSDTFVPASDNYILAVSDPENCIKLHHLDRKHCKILKVKHSESVSPQFELALGNMYFTGSAGIKDVDLAISHYRKSGEIGLNRLVSALYASNNASYQSEALHLIEDYESRTDTDPVTLRSFNFILGKIYREGKVVKRDLNKAIEQFFLASLKSWSNAPEMLYVALLERNNPGDIKVAELVIRAYCENGHPDGYGAVARAYRDGKGYKQDLQKAAEWMRKARAKNVIYADWELFDILWRINTPDSLKEMVSLAEPLAESGNGMMQGRMARAYREGRGVPKDLNRASELMRKAYKNGVSWASWELFDILWRINTPESDAEMISVAEPLAESGNSNLQGRMGRAYCDGRGVPKDLNKAAEWMRKAYENNLRWAGWELFDILWRINTPDSLKEMISMAEPKAAEGIREYEARMARAYREGRGVPKDLKKAADLMRSAYGKGVVWAGWELCETLWRINTPETDAEMVSIAGPQAEKGNREYEARMARAYRDGRGVPQDRQKAAELYRSAESKGLRWAGEELKKMESS
jgi:FkbH-like protein